MAKSLKAKNNLKLWLIVAGNSLFYFAVLEANEIRIAGVSAALGKADTLLPVGAAGIIATVLNSIMSADIKASLIFLRWKHALPGHRAFSKYAGLDTRINRERLLKRFDGVLPAEPEAQNAEWYKLYQSVREDVAIEDALHTFLFLRDYAALSVLFFFFFGLLGFHFISNGSTALGYSAILIVQYLATRQAAQNAGVRLVTNVLALKTSEK